MGGGTAGRVWLTKWLKQLTPGMTGKGNGRGRGRKCTLLQKADGSACEIMHGKGSSQFSRELCIGGLSGMTDLMHSKVNHHYSVTACRFHDQADRVGIRHDEVDRLVFECWGIGFTSRSSAFRDSWRRCKFGELPAQSKVLNPEHSLRLSCLYMVGAPSEASRA